MRDIFGKRASDYEVLRQAAALGVDVDAYTATRASMPAFAGGRSTEHRFTWGQRATVGAEPFAVGDLDDLSAVQTQVEETLYERAEFLDWVPLNREIDEGQEAQRFYIGDHTGSAGPIDVFGTDAPVVRSSRRVARYPLEYGGARVIYADQELAAAASVGMSLPADTISEATDECLLEMQNWVLNGGEDLKGLLNQDTRASNATSNLDRIVTRAARSGGWVVGTSVDTDPQAIANDIKTHIGYVLTDSNNLMRRIGGELVIALPSAVYLQLDTTNINEYQTTTVLNHVREQNAWTGVAAGNSVRFLMLNDLTTSAMLWINSRRVLEMGASIMPRVKAPVRYEYHVSIPLEFKASRGVAIKQPGGVKQVTAVAS